MKGTARVFIGKPVGDGFYHEGYQGKITANHIGIHLKAGEFKYKIGGETSWLSTDDYPKLITIPWHEVNMIEWEKVK